MVDRRRLGDEASSTQRLLQDLTEARQRVVELESVLVDEVSRAVEVARERAERELRIKEAIIDASVAGLALWDLQGCIGYVNPAFLAMWGYADPEDVQGSDIWDLLADDPKVATIGSSVEQIGGWIGKLTAIGKDGSPFTVMLSVSLVREHDGAPSCVVGSFVEMTYRERLNAMLFRQADWLRAVHEIDRGILSGTGPQKMGEAALTALRDLIPCVEASVTLFDLKAGEASLLAVVPEGDSGATHQGAWVTLAGFEETMEALQQEEIYIVGHVLQPPLPASGLGIGKTSQPNTYVLVPLACEGELLGSLNLALKQRGRLTGLHKSIVRQVADSLAVAYRHAQLAERVADLTEQLRAFGTNPAERAET
jgi:PAS domain S-box-containing protein